MSQQNKANVSGNFTEDIEATIDDLFTPVKEIEIDPLTNEVKEKGMSRAAQQETPSCAPPDTSAEKGAAEEKSAGEAGMEESIDLELELDIDLEEEVSSSEAHGEQGGGIGREVIEKFSENIMSLEWEIKQETIQTALEQAREIREQGQEDTDLQGLIVPMIAMLSGMLKEPDLIPAAPIALKKGAEALKEYVEKPEGAEEVRTAAEEIRRLMDEVQEDAQPPEASEEADLVLEPVSVEEDIEQGSADVQEAGVQGAETELEIEFELEEESGAEVRDVPSPEQETPVQEQAQDVSMEQSGEIEQQVELELASAEEGHEPISSEPSEPSEASHDQTGQHGKVQQPAPVSSFQKDGTEKKDRSDDAQEMVGVPQESESVPGAQVLPSATDGELESERGESKQDAELRQQYARLSMAVEKHIHELDRLASKIAPVEKLLAKTQGMAKLYAFQKAVRSSIETEKDRLEAVLHNHSLKGEEGPQLAGPVEEAAPKISDRKDNRQVTERCPWSRLALMGLGNGKIAVPVEEMAFTGKISGRHRKKLQQETEFPLAWLKSWPWTKIAPSLSGPLAKFSEKELRGMKFPIINSEIFQVMGLEDPHEKVKNPTTVIMFDGKGKGGVLYVDTEIETSDIDEDVTWKPSMSDKGPVAGTVRLGDETITVISMRS